MVSDLAECRWLFSCHCFQAYGFVMNIKLFRHEICCSSFCTVVLCYLVVIILLLSFIFNLVVKKNPFQVKLIILVDIKAKRFEECDHLCIAAASVSNISERMHKLCC